MKRIVFALSTVGLACGCESIADLLGGEVLRTSDLRTSVVAHVRDETGRPVAIGAMVSIWNEDGAEGQEVGFGDSLTVYVSAGNAKGRFTVRVSKPWYGRQVLSGVEVSGGDCGVYRGGEGVVEVTLRISPDAPPVQQVVLPPGGYGFGDGGFRTRIPAYVEATGGVSRELVWGADTMVVALEQDGTITSLCLLAPATTWVTAWSAVDPSKRDSIDVSVEASPAGSTRCP